MVDYDQTYSELKPAADTRTSMCGAVVATLVFQAGQGAKQRPVNGQYPVRIRSCHRLVAGGEAGKGNKSPPN